jgi:hypothetical protein
MLTGGAAPITYFGVSVIALLTVLDNSVTTAGSDTGIEAGVSVVVISIVAGFAGLDNVVSTCG